MYPDTAKFLLPSVVAKRKISAAPFLLLRSTSPFACAFKPWAWLIHWGLDAIQNFSVSLFAQDPHLSLPPNLVLRRRSPRDPRITGPAGRVKWHQMWGMRYDHPPDNGFERYCADSETFPRHFARVSRTSRGKPGHSVVVPFTMGKVLSKEAVFIQEMKGSL